MPMQAVRSRRRMTIAPVSAAPVVQRKCVCAGKSAPCDKCAGVDKPQAVSNFPELRIQEHEPSVARALDREHPDARATAPAQIGRLLHSESGEALDANTRRWAEGWLHHDLTGVRVHRSAPAQRSARNVHATAYTVGQHIVFAAHQFAPGSAAGRSLLAHELVHTVQQGRVTRFDDLRMSSANDPAERQAEAMALDGDHGERGGVAALDGGSVGGGAARGMVQRARTGIDPSKPGPSPRPKEEDTCATYEKDRESMVWSIARHMYRVLGRPWPMIDSSSCKAGPEFCPINCEAMMGDGLRVAICCDPAKNTVSSGLIEVKDGIRHILASCDLSYSCPTPSQIEFSGTCDEADKKGG